jgi:hypothetical protein
VATCEVMTSNSKLIYFFSKIPFFESLYLKLRMHNLSTTEFEVRVQSDLSVCLSEA